MLDGIGIIDGIKLDITEGNVLGYDDGSDDIGSTPRATDGIVLGIIESVIEGNKLGDDNGTDDGDDDGAALLLGTDDGILDGKMLTDGI